LYLLTSASGVFLWGRCGGGGGGASLDFSMGISPCPEMSFYINLLSPYCEREEKYSIFPLSAGQGQSPINPSLIQFVYRVSFVLYSPSFVLLYSPSFVFTLFL
jgi:hypothetical protein